MNIYDMDLWLILGFGAQLLFFSRFLIQWIVSEKKKKSVIPPVFWYLSLGGGVLLLGYAIHIRDPVFILGQGVGILVYVRNIFLMRKEE